MILAKLPQNFNLPNQPPSLGQNIANGIVDGIWSRICQFFADLWVWFTAISFWLVLFGVIILIFFYVASGDRKYMQKIGVLFMIYVLIMVVNMAL
jgi:hypothetical protein